MVCAVTIPVIFEWRGNVFPDYFIEGIAPYVIF
jgi:hypothetical protein